MALQVADREAGQQIVTGSCRRGGAARSATWSSEDVQTVFGLDCVIGSGTQGPDPTTGCTAAWVIMPEGPWPGLRGATDPDVADWSDSFHGVAAELPRQGLAGCSGGCTTPAGEVRWWLLAASMAEQQVAYSPVPESACHRPEQVVAVKSSNCQRETSQSGTCHNALF